MKLLHEFRMKSYYGMELRILGSTGWNMFEEA